jgi:hypothetical protein
MTASLILHIGHAKTGTTTLQKLVFPQLSRTAYFDRDKTPASAEIEKAFMSSPEIWRQRGAEILALLRAEMRDKKCQGSALISAANMSTHRIFAPWAPDNCWRDPFLLALHLRECRVAAAAAGFDRVKVIMGIRRQDQYLGSRYATYGWFAEKPGQDDFERQTLEIIDPDKRYFLDGVWLDYNMTHTLIAERVGEENVLFLPLEQLGDEPSLYLSSLSAFLGEPLDIEILSESREKVRGIAPDIWKLRGKLMSQAARRKSFGRLRALFARDTEIRLPLELKERVLKVYRDSNKSLASRLNLDLARYGYF